MVQGLGVADVQRCCQREGLAAKVAICSQRRDATTTSDVGQRRRGQERRRCVKERGRRQRRGAWGAWMVGIARVWGGSSEGLQRERRAKGTLTMTWSRKWHSIEKKSAACRRQCTRGRKRVSSSTEVFFYLYSVL